MRVITFCVLLLLILFLGHSIYDRTTASRKLTQANQMLPIDPEESYRVIKEALDYNRLVALGKIGAVENEYLKNIEQKFVVALKNDPPQAPIYPAMEKAIVVLDQLGRQTGKNTREVRNTILKAARDSVPVLQEKGSLEAWDRMREVFQRLGQDPAMMAEVFDDYTAWFAKVQAVPRRPIGLRDTIKLVRNDMLQTLSQLHLTAAGPTDCEVAPAPSPTADGLADSQLIEAEKIMTHATDATGHFKENFNEKDIAPELCQYRVILHYNKAAIKLAHFQDRKRTLYKTSSDYIIEVMIQPNTSPDSVPSPSELVGAFVMGAKGEFNEIEKNYLDRTTYYDDSMKLALRALFKWTDSQIDTSFADHPQMTPAQTEALQSGAELTGPAAAIIQAMKQNSRALIITRIP